MRKKMILGLGMVGWLLAAAPVAAAEPPTPPFPCSVGTLNAFDFGYGSAPVWNGFIYSDGHSLGGHVIDSIQFSYEAECPRV